MSSSSFGVFIVFFLILVEIFFLPSTLPHIGLVLSSVWYGMIYYLIKQVKIHRG